MILYKPALYVVSGLALLCYIPVILTRLPDGLITASSLPWPGEEGLEILHYRIEDIQRTITDNLRLSSPNPVTISLFEDNFFVTDVQLPLLFVGLRFDKFVASRPARVDMLAKMTVCF